VILVVAFLTILATTLLYVTGMNFVIKQADYQNKKNFYTGETVLEEVKATLMRDIVSKAAQEAFNESCKTFVTASDPSVRQVEYNGYFVEALTKELNDDIGSQTWDVYLTNGFTDHTNGTLEMERNATVTRDGLGDLVDETGTNGTLSIDEIQGIVVIRGLKVTYINENALATVISTDLEIHAPEIKWDNANGSSKSIESGETVDDAVKKDKVEVSRSVRYTNWVKE